MKGNIAQITNYKIMSVGVILIIIFIVGSVCWWIRLNSRVSTDDARVKGTMITVSPKVDGRVAEVLVKEGDAVTQGQVIARLEQREYENQVAQAMANLAVAKAKLAAAISGNRPQEVAQANAKVLEEQALYQNTKRNYDRDVALFQKGAVSSQQLDASEAVYMSAKAQYQASQEQYSLSKEGTRSEDIEVAQAYVEQAKATLENAKIQLQDTVIKAPSDGTIGLKSVEVGELVAVGKPLFNITNLGDIWIGANIEETSVGKINLGNRAEFTVDAYPGETFTGEVIETGPASGSQFAVLPTENSAGNFTKVTQRLPIKIKANATEHVLKPGMSAIITVYVQ